MFVNIPYLIKMLFQELRLDGNRLKRVPTESLGGPASLQNLHLQDNIIGECQMLVTTPGPPSLPDPLREIKSMRICEICV